MPLYRRVQNALLILSLVLLWGVSIFGHATAGLAALLGGTFALFIVLLWLFLAGDDRETLTDHQARRLLVLIILGATALLFHPRFVWDDLWFYAPLRSLVYDGDTNLVNEMAYGPLTGFRHMTHSLGGRGHTFDVGKFGPAMLWWPFAVGTRLLVVGLKQLGLPLIDDGMSQPFLLGVGAGTLCYFTLGLLATYSLCRRVTTPWFSLLATLGTFFCSFLVSFVFHWPLYSHALSYALFAMFLFLWFQVRGHPRPLVLALLFGWVAGEMVIVRPQNGIMWVIPALDALGGWYRQWRRRPDPVTAPPVPLVLGSALGVALGFLPQLLIQLEKWGWPPSTGACDWYYTDEGRLHLFGILLHPFHGLFSWHPFLLLGVIGVGVLLARVHSERRVAAGMVLALLGQTLIIAHCQFWNACASFGQRKYCGSVVLFAMGLAALYRVLTRPWRVLLTLALCVGTWWNLVLLAQFDKNPALGHSRPLTWELLQQQFTHGHGFLLQLVRQADWVWAIHDGSWPLRFTVLVLSAVVLALALRWRPQPALGTVARIVPAFMLASTLLLTGMLLRCDVYPTLAVFESHTHAHWLPQSIHGDYAFRGGVHEITVPPDKPLDLLLAPLDKHLIEKWGPRNLPPETLEQDYNNFLLTLTAYQLTGWLTTDSDVPLGQPAVEVTLYNLKQARQTDLIRHGPHIGRIDADTDPHYWKQLAPQLTRPSQAWQPWNRVPPVQRVYSCRLPLDSRFGLHRIRLRYTGTRGAFVYTGFLAEPTARPANQSH